MTAHTHPYAHTYTHTYTHANTLSATRTEPYTYIHTYAHTSTYKLTPTHSMCTRGRTYTGYAHTEGPRVVLTSAACRYYKELGLAQDEDGDRMRRPKKSGSVEALSINLTLAVAASQASQSTASKACSIM